MSKFQPNHKGEHPQVQVHDGMTVAHSSSREHIGEQSLTHGYDGGKSPKPKHGSGVTPVHGGMTRQVQGAPITGGGWHKSYLDSLSGATVPDARNTAAAGWDSGGNLRSGNPMSHAPASKQTKRAPIHPSMSKGADHDQMLADLGEAVLKSAVRN